MISLGIFSGYFPYSLDETIQALKCNGIHSVQLDLRFKDYPQLKNKNSIGSFLTKETAKEISNKFRDADIDIVAIYGYTNLIEKDQEVRKKNIQYITSLLKFARYFGTPYVVTETGTYSSKNDYAFDEKNHTEYAYQDLLSVVQSLVKVAEKYQSVLLIEPYVNNVIHSIEWTNRILNDISSSSFGLCLDPANYFCEDNLDRMDEVLQEIFNHLPSDKIYIAHAKDVCLKNTSIQEFMKVDQDVSHSYRGDGNIDLPAAGLGSLNYPLYLRLLSVYHPNIPLIMEHLNMDDIPRTKKFLKDILKEING